MRIRASDYSELLSTLDTIDLECKEVVITIKDYNEAYKYTTYSGYMALFKTRRFTFKIDG